MVGLAAAPTQFVRVPPASKVRAFSAPIAPAFGKDTAALAMIQPFTYAPAPTVTEVPAIMEPSSSLPAPRVAAEPRANKTFSALAPLSRLK